MPKKNVERFKGLAKDIRRFHSEYLKLVSTAQTVVPDAVHSMRAMHRMMGLMNEALKHSGKIEEVAYKAFRQLAKCPDKRKRGPCSHMEPSPKFGRGCRVANLGDLTGSGLETRP